MGDLAIVYRRGFQQHLPIDLVFLCELRCLGHEVNNTAKGIAAIGIGGGTK